MDPLSRRIEKLTPLQKAVFALKETRAKLEALQRAGNEPIAIVGMACRFPGGADGPDAFWKLLCDGTDAVTEIPPQRFNADEFYDPDPQAPGKMNTRRGGFIDRIEQFDNDFFRISQREALHIDPQQRLLLELAYEALENAGIPSDRLGGSPTGVFVGISISDYGIMLYQGGLSDGFVATGNHLSVAANRISFTFDLRGPSMAIDTACSSSLVGVHLACQSLRSGESRLALVGGANAILSPYPLIDLTKAGFSSPSGRCRSFDAAADGYVRGEGGGMVVLKPLAKALADGDSVYAVIRGSAVGQDGHSNGLTAPHRQAQEAVLRNAYQQAGISPGKVQFVETQGTGTPLGDAIEALALGNVLAEDRPAGNICTLGSVKTNLGHLEAASGIAGLIKTALALKHRQLPANLHFQTPNPSIPFDTLPLAVQQSLEAWPESPGPALAGVSAFGFAGTLAHVVLEEAPAPETPAPPALKATAAEPACLVPLSARNEDALRDLAGAYAGRLAEGSVSLHDLSYTTGLRRNHHDHRLALAIHSCEEARELLDAFGRGEIPSDVAAGCKPFDRRPKLAFLFSGDLSAWQPCTQVLADEPAFREALADWQRRIYDAQGWSLAQLIEAAPGDARWQDPAVALPGLLALQTSLTGACQAAGIIPDIVIGSGQGESAAACAAGVLTAGEALQVAVYRGQCLAGLAPPASLATIDARKARLPLLLEAAGEVRDADAVASDYWARATVETASAPALADRLRRHRIETVLEIGPPVRGPQMAEHLGAGDSQGLALAALQCRQRPGEGLCRVLAELYVRGHGIDWQRLHAAGGTCLRLPTYPWQRRSFWVEFQSSPAPDTSPEATAQPADWMDSAPVGKRADLKIPYVAPRTALERHVAGLWAKTLNFDRIGIHDNFLELGGSSLQAAALINRLQQQIHVTVSPVALFEAQTVHDLAAYLHQEYPSAVDRLLAAEEAAAGNGTSSGKGSAQRSPVAPSGAAPDTTPRPPQIPAVSPSDDPQRLLAQLDELSDDDVDALLRKSLEDREKDDE